MQTIEQSQQVKASLRCRCTCHKPVQRVACSCQCLLLRCGNHELQLVQPNIRFSFTSWVSCSSSPLVHNQLSLPHRTPHSLVTMKTNAFTVFSFLAFASAATAVSTQLIKNYCAETVYLTLTNDSGASDGPFDLPSQQAYLNDIVGQGNDCKVSFSPDIFSPNTRVFILGTSTYNGILYW